MMPERTTIPIQTHVQCTSYEYESAGRWMISPFGGGGDCLFLKYRYKK